MKKRAFSWLLITAFILTTALLGRYALQDLFAVRSAAADAAETTRYAKRAEIMLGDVKAYDYNSFAFVQGALRQSGAFFAAGTERGDVLLFDLQGKLLWQKNVGIGKIKALAFDPLERWLFVGEESPAGNFYALSLADGAEIHRYALADVLGSDAAKREYPAVIGIAAAQGCVYFAAQRRVVGKDRQVRYHSRVGKWTPDAARPVWIPDETMDTALSGVSCNARGDRAVFGTNNWKSAAGQRFSATVYFIADGALRRGQTLPPKAPYQNTTLSGRPQMHADGSVVCLTGDGRAALYDAAGQELWRRALSQPQELDDVSLNAVGVKACFLAERAAFVLGGTYNRNNYRLPTPLEDPNADTLFLFDAQGRLLAKQHFAASGVVESVETTESLLLLAIGRDLKHRQADGHGVLLLRATDGVFYDRIPTRGPCIAAAATADGAHLAVLEAPLQLPSGEIVGAYRLHFFARKSA